MTSTLLRFAPLLLAPALAAQLPVQAPASQPTPEATRPEPTPQERIAKLKAQLEKLQQERDYLDHVAKTGGPASRVKEFFTERKLSARTIADTAAPRPRPATPEGPTGRPARLMGDDEKAKFSDAIMLVDGLPVAKAEFDATFKFAMEATPRKDTAVADILKEDVLQWLIRRKAVQAAFQEQSREARNTILAAQRKLKDGADFAAVAREMSQCPSRENGGALGAMVIGQGSYDLFYRRGAFGTKVGEISDIVETIYGYHLIKVTSRDDDKQMLESSHILALYHPDQTQLPAVGARIDQGQLDLALADEALRKYLPPAYR